MSIEEYNKRKNYVSKQIEEVKKFLFPRIKESGFWIICRAIKQD